MNTKTAEEILNERIKYYIGTASTDKGMRSIIVECMEKYAFQLKDKLKETRMYAPEYLHESIDMLITKNDFVVSAEEYASPLKKRIEELENQWISVEERLPELGEVVIVEWADHVTVGYLHKDGNFYPAHPAPYTLPVTQWMKLPNPSTNGKQDIKI